MLSHRHSEILKLVVQHHIIHGGAVGSQTICDHSHLGLSSATIRSAMAELEEMGLLSQPHRSSGRIPTDKGFRMYVDCMERHFLPESEKERIAQAFQSGWRDLDATLDKVCQVLADLTPYAWLALPPRLDDAVLMCVQFIKLSQYRVSAILISVSGQVWHRLLTMDGDYSQRQLDSYGHALSSHLEGMTLYQARERLQWEVQGGKEQYRELCRCLLRVVSSSGMGDDHLIINGRSNLLGLSWQDYVPDIRRVLEALEQKKKLIALLDLCLHSEGVQLFIGSESPLGPVQGCSVVAAKFSGPERRLLGTLGVLGPTRLNYAHVIPLVGYVASILSTHFSPILPPQEEIICAVGLE
ncbi:MAG: heat-inducible transcriptional repressor HrcA [Magnetococcus sp. DMHC-6]